MTVVARSSKLFFGRSTICASGAMRWLGSAPGWSWWTEWTNSAPSVQTAMEYFRGRLISSRVNRRKIGAQTHVPAACPSPSQEARVSFENEKPGRTQSPCGASQERPPQSYASLIRRNWDSLAPAAWCAAVNTMRCIGMGGANRVANSRYFFVPMAS